jgi:hypothetical protein
MRVSLSGTGYRGHAAAMLVVAVLVGGEGCSGGGRRANPLDDVQGGCRAIALLGDGTVRGAPDEAAREELARLRAVVDWRNESGSEFAISPSGRSVLVRDRRSGVRVQRYIREWWNADAVLDLPAGMEASFVTDDWMLASVPGPRFLIPAAAPLDRARWVALPFVVYAWEVGVWNGERIALIERPKLHSDEPTRLWKGFLGGAGVIWEEPVALEGRCGGAVWSGNGEYVATSCTRAGSDAEDVVVLDAHGRIVNSLRGHWISGQTPSGPDHCFEVTTNGYPRVSKLYFIGERGELREEYPGLGFSGRSFESFAPGGRCACVLGEMPTEHLFNLGRVRREGYIVEVPIRSLSHEDMHPVGSFRGWLCWPPGSGRTEVVNGR